LGKIVRTSSSGDVTLRKRTLVRVGSLAGTVLESPMTAAKALRVLAPPVVLAACTGLMVALMIALADPAPDGRPVDVLVRSAQGLLIAESAGLYPGTTQTQVLRLTNPNDVEISVHALTAVAGNPIDRHGRPVTGCLPVIAQVEPLGEPVRIPPSGSHDVTITVRLAATVQRACKQVRFPLFYSGAASRP
jgi:hypothetical protein